MATRQSSVATISESKTFVQRKKRDSSHLDEHLDDEASEVTKSRDTRRSRTKARKSTSKKQKVSDDFRNSEEVSGYDIHLSTLS